MSENFLLLLQAAVAAKILEEIEAVEVQEKAVILRIKSRTGLHEFCIPRTEDIAKIIFNYMDAIDALDEKAFSIEQIWNKLSFDYCIITRLLINHPDGLQVFADFQYSPLVSIVPWHKVLQTSGLFLVSESLTSSDRLRSLVLQKDHILA